MGALTGDPRLEPLLRRQRDVVARRQLRALGSSDRVIGSWIARGLLMRVDRGVYALGRHRLTREGRWMAAVLATGEAAALSHASAVALWGLRPPDLPLIAVVLPGRSGREGRGRVTVHSSVQLGPAEVTRKLGIPVTRPERTLIDFADVTECRPVERALDEAMRLNLTTEARLRQATELHPGRHGAAKLSAVSQRARRRHDRHRKRLRRAPDHPLRHPPHSPPAVPGVDWQLPSRFHLASAVPDSGDRRPRDARDAQGFRRRSGTRHRAHRHRYRTLRFTWLQLTRQPAWVARMIGSALGR